MATQRIRRDRGGRPVRRLANGDAAGSQGPQGPPGGQGPLPKRHAVDSHGPSTGDCVAAAMGAARPTARDRMPGDRALQVRLRTVHDRRADQGRPKASLWATARAGRSSTSFCVDAAAEAGAEIREGFSVDEILFEDGRVSGVRGHTQGGTVHRRACARVVIGADGRHSLVAKAVRPEQYNEKPPLRVRLLHVLEQPAGGGVRDLHPSASRLGGHSHARRLDAGRHRMAVRGVRDQPEGRRRERTSSRSSSRLSSPSACAAPSARRPFQRRRDSELLPQAIRSRVGRSSATPATSRIR